MSYKFKLKDVNLGDDSQFKMSIGNLEVETSAEVYKILVPFYEKILASVINVFKADQAKDAIDPLDFFEGLGAKVHRSKATKQKMSN